MGGSGYLSVWYRCACVCARVCFDKSKDKYTTTKKQKTNKQQQQQQQQQHSLQYRMTYRVRMKQ